jgi:hypothetical protein
MADVTTPVIERRRDDRAQVDEVRATTGIDIKTVIADASYAYVKVYGALPRALLQRPLCALLASGQINMRKLDGWQTDNKPSSSISQLTSLDDSITSPRRRLRHGKIDSA